MLNFGPNPKVWQGGPFNPSVDPTSGGTGYSPKLAKQRWGAFNEAQAHPFAHDADAYMQDLIARSKAGTVPDNVAQILRNKLGWDGASITYLESRDLDKLEAPSGLPWSVQIIRAMKEAGLDAAPADPAPQPDPTPQPEPQPTPHPVPTPPPATGLDGRVSALELAVVDLLKRVTKLDGGSSDGLNIR